MVLNGDFDRARAPGEEAAADVPEGGETDLKTPEERPEHVPLSVFYAKQNASSQWTQPESFLFCHLPLSPKRHNIFDSRFIYSSLSNRVYARTPYELRANLRDKVELVHAINEEVPWYFFGVGGYSLEGRFSVGYLRESDGGLFSQQGSRLPPDNPLLPAQDKNPFVQGIQGSLLYCPMLRLKQNSNEIHIVDDHIRRSNLAEINAEITNSAGSNTVCLEVDENKIDGLTLNAVDGSTRDIVLRFDSGQFIVLHQRDSRFAGNDSFAILDNTMHRVHPIDTQRPLEMRETFLGSGLGELLSLRTQARRDLAEFEKGLFYKDFKIAAPTFMSIAGLSLPWIAALAEFTGAHGQYLWEFHYHLPFLAAHSLNARGKFREADVWYRKIFDPIGKVENINSYWRFAPFVFTGPEKLRDILTNQQAISAYESDPFNPFAIARLRPTAFQKTIVMRYIDNLIDWGDGTVPAGHARKHQRSAPPLHDGCGSPRRTASGNR